MPDYPFKSNLRGLVPLVICVCLLAVGLGVAVTRFDADRVRSPSMAPTLRLGDRVLFTAVEDASDIHRDDIVRFRAPWPEVQGFGPITFRVIGTGGDTVMCCKNGQLLRNDRPIPARGSPTSHADSPADQFQIIVPHGRVFVIGDAGSIANDSRQHLDMDSGTVPASAVTGRLEGVAWPLWRWRPIATEERFISPSFVGASTAIVVGSVGIVTLLVRRGRKWFRLKPASFSGAGGSRDAGVSAMTDRQ